MGLKYNKNDGQLLTSALDHNLQVADQIISDLQEGVNRLTSYMDDPFGGLSGKAYNAANTLFKSIIQPTLSKLESATADIRADLHSFKYAISEFDYYDDTIYDKEEIERTLDIKRQQKALVENQLRFFNDTLVTGLAKSAVENLQFEGKQLESVLTHYEEEIKKLENKLRILEEASWQTSSLFQDSLQVFQNALQGAKALRNGSFDASGNFKVSSNTDMNWYKQMIGQDLSSSLVSGDRDPNTLPEEYRKEVEAIKNSNLSEVEKADKITAIYEKYLYSLAPDAFSVYFNIYSKNKPDSPEVLQAEKNLSLQLQNLPVNILDIVQQLGNDEIDCVDDPLNYLLFIGMVNTKKPIDLKSRPFNKDDKNSSIWARGWNGVPSADYLGNYLFGYYGAGSLFATDDILKYGAGFAQQASDAVHLKLIGEWNKYMDNLGDSEAIQDGIDAYIKQNK
ncbi:MAG: polymorphic toxin type 44 domain-containing protein [Lactococcus garvieae]